MRTRQFDIDPDDAPPIPRFAMAIAETEVEAMKVMKAAAEVQVAQIKSAINDRSGTLSRSVASSVRRIPGGGLQLRFGSIKKAAFTSRKGDRVTREQYGGEGGKTKKQRVFYADFVDRGTGIAGPRGKTIVRKGLIPVGRGVREPSGSGQRPQGMFRRAREQYLAAAPAVDEQVERDLTQNLERRR